MQEQISFKVQLHFTTKKEDNWIIAYCPKLDVTSQGHTEKEAIQNLIEAVQLFIESCYKRGTLDEVLKDRGFKFFLGARESKAKKEDHFLEVPLSLIANHARAQNHAG